MNEVEKDWQHWDDQLRGSAKVERVSRYKCCPVAVCSKNPSLGDVLPNINKI